MGFRDGLFRWTIPAGRWGRTAVRISVLIPLAGLAAAVHAADVATFFAVSSGSLLTAAVAEAARCALAARTNAPVRELLLWPLGGLEPAESTPTRSPWVHVSVPAAAAAVCVLCGGAFFLLGWPVVWEPKVTPAAAFLVAGAAVVGANLLPAVPLAAGRAIRDLWAQRSGPFVADSAAAGLTHLIGALWLFLGLAVGSAWLAAGAAVVMLIARGRRPRPAPRPPREENETFLGYDFSAGYTSLERDEAPADETDDDFAASLDDADAPADTAKGAPASLPLGPLASWRRQREAQRRRRELEDRLVEEVEVDRLLRKISAEGETSLSAAERRTLQRAAARLRQSSADG